MKREGRLVQELPLVAGLRFRIGPAEFEPRAVAREKTSPSWVASFHTAGGGSCRRWHPHHSHVPEVGRRWWSYGPGGWA